jgi:hypothetical protein
VTGKIALGLCFDPTVFGGGCPEKICRAGMMEQLNRAEKVVLARYLQTPRTRIDSLFSFGTYIFPSLVFAIYGILKMDFAAVAVAYLALLIAAILYLSYQRRNAVTFHSALTKLAARMDELEPRVGGTDEGTTR